MRVLAVDLGAKRVGLARSDESRTIAEPYGTLAGEPAATLVERLAEAVRAAGATEVVIGLPRRLDGSAGPEAAAARAVADQLRRLTRLRVELMDERLTSAQAERVLLAGGSRRARRREVVDRVAATLILQSYLERRRVRP